MKVFIYFLLIFYLISFLLIFVSCGDNIQHTEERNCDENETLVENRCDCNGYSCESFQKCDYDDDILTCILKENACFSDRNCNINEKCVNNYCEEK